MTAPTPREPGPGDQVFLIDGSSFIFRAYFQSINQDQKYNYRSDRLPTGAVRLFCTIMLKITRDGVLGRKATHLAIVFDKTEKTFRNAIYPEYKAHRPDPPSELVPQFPLMREAVRAFGLTPCEQAPFEADDLIATYAREARARGAEVVIVSADKDLMQIVGPGVTMYDPASGEKNAKGSRPERIIGEAEVVERFGVPPHQVIDVQALAGDSTDNVPGVPGIGVKTAAALISEFGDLETLLARAGEIKQPKRRESLIQFAEQARISKRLVTLDTHAALPCPLESLAVPEPDPGKLIAFLKAMEFSTITRRVADLYGIDPSAIEPDSALAPAAPAFPGGAGEGSHPPLEGEGGEGERSEGLPGEGAAPLPGRYAADPGSSPGQAPPHKGEGGILPSRAGLYPERSAVDLTPADRAAAAKAAALAVPIDVKTYETVRTLDRLEWWIGQARARGLVAVDTETTSLDPMRADLVGVSLATDAGEACYIPVGHRTGDDLFGGAGLAPDQIPVREVLDRLRPVLEDPAILKIGQNFKYDWLVFARHGIDIAPFDDTMLISYALDAGAGISGSHGMDELSKKHLGYDPITYKAVTGTGKAAVGFDRVAIDRATEYAAEDADVTLRLWMLLKPRLAPERVATVYETLERPIVTTLAAMERRGIAIDRQILARLSGDFAQSLARLEAEIHALAGETFTIGSPKQLGDILFGRMGLPGAKRTPTGAWATGADVLEDLAAAGHELPQRVLDWRQLAKLKSTYTDSLPTYLHPETGRVHTCFSLASTTTGRLSSSEPNLQNIPVRTDEGRKIRTAFVAPAGRKLVSADYSQIELRVLAHIADIPQLRQAFSDGLDIHAMTASEMFGVPVHGMDPLVRRRAKAINFGIIYGISAFGLANQLGIGREEAGAYIKKYFERFPGIRGYMDETKKTCRRDGYVTTLFGRKIHFSEIASKNPSLRAFHERASINAPIQGSAADIIRRAMIRMDDALEAAGLSAQMLLQVHDELIFEVADEEVAATLPVVSAVMEAAPDPVLKLAVPLQVDARAAQNWEAAH